MLGRKTLVACAAVTAVGTGGITVPATGTARAWSGPPTCWGRPATIVGSGLIHGTRGDDVIVVRGAGEVHAGAGDDRVCGALVVFGGPGSDRIRYGGRGGDYPELHGGAGADVIVLRRARLGYLYGEGGPDVLRGAGGEQWLSGGPGDDRIAGGDGADHLFGQRGDDELRGGPGADVGDGGPGTDRCRAVEDTSRCER